jgi:hypothetical protein
MNNNFKLVMSDKYKPVYVRGTQTGNGVIKALEQLGGINRNRYKGNNPDNLYFICPKTHEIDYAFSNTPYGNYLEETGKEIKPFRWRAEQNEDYYTIDSTMLVIESIECGDRYDNGRYESGNYFKTIEEAKEAVKQIKKILLPN